MQALPALKRNDQGIDVRRLQGLLAAAGHVPKDSTHSDGSFDGQFGENTEKALQAVTGSKVATTAAWKHLLGV